MKYQLTLAETEGNRPLVETETFEDALYYLNKVAEFRKASGWSTAINEQTGTLSCVKHDLKIENVYSIKEVA